MNVAIGRPLDRVLIVGQADFAADPSDPRHPNRNLHGREVWVINGPRFPATWHRLFQLHGTEHLCARHGHAFVELLGRIAPPLRLYMTEARASIPHAEVFPVEEARRRFGDYFTGSFPYAIALAIMEGARSIALEGIDFRENEQWAVPCIEHFLGIAVGAGIEVQVPEDRGIFGPGPWGPRYGFEGAGAR